jgi:MFS family permease
VKEPEMKADKKKRPFPIRKSELVKLPKTFWIVVAFASAFMLARFSEAFLLLRADSAGLRPAFVPLILIVMNIVYAGSAYPVGVLSDRIGKYKLLTGGIAVLIAGQLMLAFDGNIYWIFAGAALWGLHMGMTQGLLSALIADTAPADLRGTAFGLFNLLIGIAALVASTLAGWLWVIYGPKGTFLAGSGFSCIALAGIGLFSIRKRH